MDKALREQLRGNDRFVEGVGHSVDYVRRNRQRVFATIGVGLLLIALGVGGLFWRGRQAEARQAELKEALRIQDALVGPAGEVPYGTLTFKTAAERSQAAIKAFGDLASKHRGQIEGTVAEYYLGTVNADLGKLDEAERHLRAAIDGGTPEYASQAKLALAQVYQTQRKQGEAERLLRSLIQSPTALVSKEQATVALARILAPSNPAEARKLLEPLRTERNAVSRVAISTLGEIAPTNLPAK